MSSQDRRDPGKEKYWREIFAKYEEGGATSKTAFCEAEGLNINNFCWWQKEISKRDAETARDQRAKQKQASDHEKKEKALQQKQEFWKKAITRFLASGLSESQFCAEEGFFPPTFIYWKDLILNGNAEAVDLGGKQDPMFVPLKAREERTHSSKLGRNVIAEIVFGGGSVLLFDGISMQALIMFLRAVSEVNDDQP